MTLKKMAWILFLLIALGTPIIAGAAGLQDSELSMTLFAGLSASLFVFLFVPHLSKFYLSEILVVIISFGVVMTLFANVLRLKPHAPDWRNFNWIVVFFISAIAMPFTTSAILEWKRPVNERIVTAALKTPIPPKERVRLELFFMVFHGLVSFVLLVVQSQLGFDSFTWFTLFIAISLLNFFTSWRLYRKSKREIEK